MKLVRITEAQASVLAVEIVGRYVIDDDADRAAVAAIVADHLARSRGTSMAVPSPLLAEMLLEVANGIDDEIEQARKGDASALDRIGGVSNLREARALWRTCTALIAKAR